jgi:hypothetical protein
MKRSPFLMIALALAAGPVVVVACGPSEPEAKTPTPEPSASVAATPAATPTPTPSPTPTETVAPPPPAPPPVVEDMTASDDPKPLPTVKILAPANDLSVGDAAKAKDATVRLDVKNWETKEGGNHVHLILDDHPYKPIYDPKLPVKLTELLPPGVELTEGMHVLHAFPSRSTHESVKGKGAGSMTVFWVGKKGKPMHDMKKPHLIYSRPKGNYGGQMAKEVLIDFYLMGTTLDKGEKVKYTIVGPGISSPLTGEFTKWAPKVAKNLGKGEFTFKLELVDKDGKPIEGMTNVTSRSVKLDPDAAADPHAGHPPMTMTSASASASVKTVQLPPEKSAAPKASASVSAAPKSSK